MTHSIMQSTKSYFGHVLDLFCHAPSMVSQSQKTKSRIEALVVGLPLFFQVGLSPISKTYEMIAVITWSRFFLSCAICLFTRFLCEELGIRIGGNYLRYFSESHQTLLSDLNRGSSFLNNRCLDAKKS